jgi:hypothetical protein
VGEIIPSQIVGLSDIEVTNVPCSSEGRGTEANKRKIRNSPDKFRLVGTSFMKPRRRKEERRKILGHEKSP